MAGLATRAGGKKVVAVCSMRYFVDLLTRNYINLDNELVLQVGI